MAKQLNIDLNFNANTAQAKSAIQDLNIALQKIQLGNIDTTKLTKALDPALLQKASQQAQELGYHLNNAFNVNTGKLDLTKLNLSLSQSKTSLSELTSTFAKLGPTGANTMAELAHSIASADMPAVSINTHLKELWVTLKNTARFQLSSSIIHGLMSGLNRAVGYAKDLNESLNNIRIVTGQSVDQMANFAKEANKAAKELSTTTTAYTDASLIFYQQGLDDTQVKKRTDITVKMANAIGESAQTVSDQLTAVWNNFAPDDATEAQLERYADVMTALGAATASSTDEISQGLEKFAAVADTVGLSYDYAASALATVTATTRQSADTVGNAFKTLFSRIQGLSLGDTLEDGTDLNKYSKALMKVGIDIKDTNGDMKQMDTILDELGAKWETLGQDQQMALAQTVAGVRQYTQLIALMDNYDYFKQNLGVAYGAEGTLQKQADIYAESWEAARDRVKAATESIYAQLIDDKALTKLTDFAAQAISGLGDFIDGFGGLKSILLSISGLILGSQAKNISSFFEKIKQDILIIVGKSDVVYNQIKIGLQDSVLQFKQQAGEFGLQLDQNTNADLNQQIEGSFKIIELKQQLNLIEKNLSNTERSRAEAQIKAAEMVQNSLVEEIQKREELKESIKKQAKEQADLQNSILNKRSEQLAKANVKAFAVNFDDENYSRINFNDITKFQEQAKQQYKNLLTNLRTEIDKEGNISHYVQDAITGQKIDLNLGNLIDFNGVDEIKNKFNQVFNDNINFKLISPENVKASMNEVIDLYSELGGQLDQSLINGIYKAAEKNDLTSLKSLYEQIKQPFESMKDLLPRDVVQNFEKTFQTFYKDIQNCDISPLQTQMLAFTKTLGNLTEIAPQTAAAITTIAKAKTPDELEAAWKQLVSTLDTLGNRPIEVAQALKLMGIPDETINSYLKGEVELKNLSLDLEKASENAERMSNTLNNSKIDVTHVVSATEAYSSLAGGLMSLASTLNAIKSLFETLSNEDAKPFEKFTAILTAVSMIAMNGKRTLESFGTAATFLGQHLTKAGRTAITAAASAGTAVSGTAASTGTAVAAAGATAQAGWLWLIGIVAAIGLLGFGVYKIVQKFKESSPEHQLEKAKQYTEECTKAVEDAKNAYDELKSTISDYKSAVDSIDELTKGTLEYAEAIDTANQKAKELINTYGVTKFTIDKNGIIQIDEAELSQAQQNSYNHLQSSELQQLGAEINQIDAQRNVSLHDSDIEFTKQTYGKGANADNLIQYLVSSLNTTNKPITFNEATNLIARTTSKNVEQIAEEFAKKYTDEDSTGLDETDYADIYKHIYNQYNELVKEDNEIDAITAGYRSEQDLINAQADSQIKTAIAAYLSPTLSNNSNYSKAINDNGFNYLYKDATWQYNKAAEEQRNKLNDILESRNGYFDTGGTGNADFIAAMQEVAADKGYIYDIESASFINPITKEKVEDFSLDNAIEYSANKSGYSAVSNSVLENSKSYNGLTETQKILATQDISGITSEEQVKALESKIGELEEVEYTNDSQEIEQYKIKLSEWGKATESLTDSEIIELYNNTVQQLKELPKKARDDLRKSQALAKQQEVKDIQERAQTINKALAKIKIGDTIDEATFESLGEGADKYFTRMADGTYKLTKDASEFYNIVNKEYQDKAIKQQQTDQSIFSTYSNQEDMAYWVNSYEQGKYSPKRANIMGSASNALAATYLTDNGYTDAFIKGIVEGTGYEVLIKNGDISEAEKELLSGIENQTQWVDTLNQFAISALENYSQTGNAIATSYGSIDELQQAGESKAITNIEYKNAFDSVVLNEAESKGLDGVEVLNYGEYLAQNAEQLEGFSDTLLNDAEACKELALRLMESNQGFTNLSKNIKDYKDVLDGTSEGTSEYANKLKSLKKDLSNAFNIDVSKFDAKFFKKNADLIEKAAEGDAASIKQLNKAIQDESQTLIESAFDFEEYSSRIRYDDIIDPKGVKQAFEMAKQAFNTGFDQLQDILDTADLDTGELLSNLPTDLYNQLEAADAQLRNGVISWENYIEALEATGIEPEIEYKKVKLTGQQRQSLTAGHDIVIDGTLYSANDLVSTDGSAEGEYMIPTVNMKMSRFGGTGGGSSAPSSSGGGGGGGSKAKSKRVDTSNRYHTNDKLNASAQNRLSAQQLETEHKTGASKIASLQKELQLNKEIQQIASDRVKENQKYLQEDLYGPQGLKQLWQDAGLNFGEIKFDSNGIITNGTELLGQINQRLKELEDDDSDEAQNLKVALEDAKAAFEGYEQTVDDLQENLQKELESYYNIIDLQSEILSQKLEIKLDVDDKELKLLEYYISKIKDDSYDAAYFISTLGDKADLYAQRSKDYKDTINELLTTNYGLTFDEFQRMSDAEKVALDITEKDMEIINQAFDGLLEDSQSLEDLRSEALDNLNNQLDKFNEKLENQLNLFEHFNTVLQDYKDITDLLGLSLGPEGKALINQIQDSMYANQLNNLSASKQALDFWKQVRNAKASNDGKTLEDLKNRAITDAQNRRLREWGTTLNNLTEAQRMALQAEIDGIDEQFNQSIETIDENIRESEANLLDNFKGTLETAKQIFEDAINEIADMYSEALSSGWKTLEGFNSAYESVKDINDKYLDDYEKLYNLSKLQRDIQKSIDDTDNLKSKKALKELMEEVVGLQESGTELSEYDLNALEKRYELKKAELALDEAQNAKTLVRLSRDNNGNWGYIYTADEDKVGKAEQEYEDKLYEYQKLNDDYINTLQDQINELSGQYQEKLTEILTSEVLTPEEKEEQIKWWQSYYQEIEKVLYNQFSNATNNQANTLSRYLASYGRENSELMDSFAETELSQTTGTLGNKVSTIEAFFTNFNTQMQASISKALDELTKDAERKKEAVESAGFDTNETLEQIAGNVELVGTASDAARTSVNNLTESMKAAFSDTLGALSTFENKYISMMDSIIEDNEKYINTLYEMVEAYAVIAGDVSIAERKEKHEQKIIDINQNESLSDAEKEKQMKEENDSYRSFMVQSFKQFDIAQARTGGYTGAWGNNGKLAILHQNELITNPEQTQQLLNATELIKVIKLNTDSLQNLLLDSYHQLINDNSKLQQEVTIHAEFPNATNHQEIEEAFSNLINEASQYANRKLK